MKAESARPCTRRSPSGSPMPRLSVPQLFDDNREKLRLGWVAGRAAAQSAGSAHLKDSRSGLIGHLNFIHPNWTQVLGRPEIDYLNRSTPSRGSRRCTGSRPPSLRASSSPAASSSRAPLRARGYPARALLASPLDSVELMWLLRPYLARELAESTTMHGVLLDVLGMGVLITGESGVGKSELALELISRGHGLVADDVVEIYADRARNARRALPADAAGLPRGARPGRAQHPHDLRRDRGAPRKMKLRLIVHLERQATATRPDRAPAARGALRGHPRRDACARSASRSRPGATSRCWWKRRCATTILKLRGIDSTAEFIARQSRELQNDRRARGDRRVDPAACSSFSSRGLSGSGKSVALNVLEDAGYYCVDNLPAKLLLDGRDFLAEAGHEKRRDQRRRAQRERWPRCPSTSRR